VVRPPGPRASPRRAAGAVGGDLQAGADLAVLRGLFEDAYPQSLAGQGKAVPSRPIPPPTTGTSGCPAGVGSQGAGLLSAVMEQGAHAFFAAMREAHRNPPTEGSPRDLLRW
jgi:hypothetical protein